MILSYVELCELVERGVIEGATLDRVNPASIDVRLGNDFMVELDLPGSALFNHPVIDLGQRQALRMRKETVQDGRAVFMEPGAFLLAHTKEMFHLPDDISAHFMLKSSIARSGLNQLSAVWADSGWHGSVLTLELSNVTRYNILKLTPGMLIGQMVFHRHAQVPEHASYRNRGRYNNDASVQGIKP